MDNFEEEKTNLFRLIDTWEDENVNLALQIIKGNSDLKRVTGERYLLWLQKNPKVKYINMLLSVVYHSNCENNNGELELSQVAKVVLSQIKINKIDLSYSNLTEFPKWLCYLEELKAIYLHHNQITKIPESIARLKKLEELILNANEITTIPENIGDLNLLRKLNLDFNQVTKVPESLGKLERLEWLCLEANKIEYLPQSLKGLKRLQWLSIEDTPLGDKHNIHYGMYVTINSDTMRKLLELEE